MRDLPACSWGQESGALCEGGTEVRQGSDEVVMAPEGIKVGTAAASKFGGRVRAVGIVDVAFIDWPL